MMLRREKMKMKTKRPKDEKTRTKRLKGERMKTQTLWYGDLKH